MALKIFRLLWFLKQPSIKCYYLRSIHFSWLAQPCMLLVLRDTFWAADVKPHSHSQGTLDSAGLGRCYFCAGGEVGYVKKLVVLQSEGKEQTPTPPRVLPCHSQAAWHCNVIQHPSGLLVRLKITKILSFSISLVATTFDPSSFLWIPPLWIPPEWKIVSIFVDTKPQLQMSTEK